MSKEIIENPTLSEITEALENGDSFQCCEHDDYVWTDAFIDDNRFSILKKMKLRIIKKPKIVLSKYGFDFTKDELPLKDIRKDYTILTSCGTTTSIAFANQDKDAINNRIETRSAFATKEAAIKWHKMMQKVYDEILSEVKY